MRKCSYCNEVKPFTEFYKDRSRPSGYGYGCKACRREQAAKKYRKRHPDARAVRKAHKTIEGRKICPLCGTEKSLADYYKDRTRPNGHMSYCKDCLRIRDGSKKRKELPRVPRGHKYCCVCCAIKPVDSFHRAARAADGRSDRCKSCTKEYMQEYAQRPRTKRLKKQAYHRRRARIRSAAIHTLTADKWEWLIQLYGGRCAYCGQVPDTLTVDHVVPISRGGNHSLSNVVPACHSCNCRKQARLPEEADMTFAVKVNTLEHMKQTDMFAAYRAAESESQS